MFSRNSASSARCLGMSAISAREIVDLPMAGDGHMQRIEPSVDHHDPILARPCRRRRGHPETAMTVNSLPGKLSHGAGQQLPEFSTRRKCVPCESRASAPAEGSGSRGAPTWPRPPESQGAPAGSVTVTGITTPGRRDSRCLIGAPGGQHRCRQIDHRRLGESQE